MGLGSWIDKKKELIVKKALDKGESISEKYSWTIHFLVDLKIVYIITYAYITFVNVISSTANTEAASDTDGMTVFNVTLSPKFRNVEVDSVNDAILWNCRRESVTNYYYRFLYWMVIVAMSGTLVGFLLIKCVALITVSCSCKNFTCPFKLNEYGLTKLWQIAVLEELKDKPELYSCPQQQHATGSVTTPAQTEVGRNNEQARSDNDPEAGNNHNNGPDGTHTQVTAIIENNTDHTDVEDRNDSSDMPQPRQSNRSLIAETESVGTQTSSASNKNEITSVPSGTNVIQPNQTDNKLKSTNCKLKHYQSLLDEDQTNDIFKHLGRPSKCTNYCRQMLPGVLLFLSVLLLGLSYLSYDLHPLACIVQPAEEFISYNATTKRVELKFSNHLKIFQKVAGGVVSVAAVTYLLLAWVFYYVSKQVISDIKSKAKERIAEVETTNTTEGTITAQHV